MIGTLVVVAAVVLAATVYTIGVARRVGDRPIGRPRGGLTERDVARGLDYDTRRYVERVNREGR